MGTGLAVRDLRFEVGGHAIVDGVTFEAGAGETLAIVGPSGCGKTTLLRLIAGLERPSGGTILFDGEPMAGVPAYRRGFGMMFQDFALFPHLDVGQNVAFGLRGRGYSAQRRRARVSELLDMVGMGGYSGRRVDSLSGGERQRVALARALAPAPRMLMLDEPLGSLDRGLRERLLLQLKTILETLSIPAIYVTHDQFEAFAIAKTLAVMRAGKLVGMGTPQSLYAEPRSEFVARFLGFENIVEGVSDGAGRVTTAIGHWEADAPAGAVRLLLRGEDIRMVEGGGPGTVTAVAVGVVFQGATAQVELDADGKRLEFSLSASGPLPGPGSRVTVSVPHVQVLAPNGDAEAAPGTV